LNSAVETAKYAKHTNAEQLRKQRVDERWLREVEQRDAIFPQINVAYRA
jgi:predicted glycosyl hydrolase (DUF1957 family)